MAFESINLNLIPTGDAPVIHAAQYDIDRPLIINMFLGEDTFTPTDLDIELQVRKVDNNIVTAVPDSVDGNTITFLTTEQMTACSGSNLCSLKFSQGDNHIATLHFFLVVQRDVLQGGLTSQSEIHDLAEQIAEIVPEVIGDEYYTAAEVDEKIAEIPTFDPTNYYDKTQLYTKTETNGLLSQKANTSSLSAVAFSGSYTDLTNTPTIPDVSNYYTKSETYNQTEVNNLLSTKADTSSLSAVATSGDYDDLTNKPTIPAAQVQSDWDQSDNTQVDYIKNKPTVIEYGVDLPMSSTDPDKVADRITALETSVSGKADKNAFVLNLNKAYYSNATDLQMVVGQVSMSFSGGVATTDISSYIGSGYSFITIAFACAKSTSAVAITGAEMSGTTLTVKSTYTGSTTTDISFLAFARKT
jgi:hypothetical protein